MSSAWDAKLIQIDSTAGFCSLLSFWKADPRQGIVIAESAEVLEKQ